MKFGIRHVIAAAAVLMAFSANQARANTIVPVGIPQVGGLGSAHNIVAVGGGFFDWYFQVNLTSAQDPPNGTGSMVLPADNMTMYDFGGQYTVADITIDSWNPLLNGGGNSGPLPLVPLAATVTPFTPVAPLSATPAHDTGVNNIVWTYNGLPYPDGLAPHQDTDLFRFHVRTTVGVDRVESYVSNDHDSNLLPQNNKGNYFAAVPEASTMLGFGGLIGMGGLAFLRRSRKK